MAWLGRNASEGVCGINPPLSVPSREAGWETLLRLFRFQRDELRIFGCVGGYAAHTPKYTIPFPFDTGEPLLIDPAVYQICWRTITIYCAGRLRRKSIACCTVATSTTLMRVATLTASA